MSPADDRARAVADDPGESADGPTGGWDDEAAALAYRAFELRHPRYASESARLGQARVLAQHTFVHRMQTLVSQVCIDHGLELPAAA